MEASELLEIVARGEDSRHQFKADATNANSLAAEMVAFANSGGGQIFVGVSDDGTIKAHDASSVSRLNQLIANAASNSVRPPINPLTENVLVHNGVVVVISVPDGLSKPYMDNIGSIWFKSGSDKRRVTSREEMQRMFQSAQLVHGDDLPIPGATVADINRDYFETFFEKRFGSKLDEQEVSLTHILTSMRLLRDDSLTVAGALLFAKQPQPLVPAFHVKAIAFPGNDIHADKYLDSQDFVGNLESQFQDGLAFITRNLHRSQQNHGVNAQGQLEVPQLVFEELLANALIHRDFFVSAPIRIFIFNDRVEIISPGHLPNNLTIENIKSGNSNMRNPILASYATWVLPYRGLGTGVLRALKEYPEIDFLDDRDGNKFCVTVRRPAGGQG